MALSLLCPLLVTFLFMQTLADTSFIQSRAAYYPNSEEKGTDGKKIKLIEDHQTQRCNEILLT